mgnify:FL=1
MKNLIVSFAMTLVFASASIAQNFDWAMSGQGNLVDEGNAVCMDAEGNSYITGNFSSNPFLLGKVSLKNSSTNPAAMDAFVAKLDAKGNVVWAIQSNGAGEERGIDIACDKTGHIVVVGVFRGDKASFGTFELTKPTRFPLSTFILRINALGNIVWAKRAGGKSQTEVKSVSTGPDGEIYLTGTFSTATNFGGYEYKSKNGNNPTAFVAKYLYNGELKWFEQIYGKGRGGQFASVSGEAIFSTEDSRFVYVTGKFRGNVTFGSGNITSSDFGNDQEGGGWNNIYITKYDSDGRGIWTKNVGVKQLNFSTIPEVKDIVVDKQGSSYITGYFPGTLTFGETEMRGNPSKNSWNHDIFLAKYDANGNHLWHRNAGGDDADYSHSMALTSNGVLITGQIVGRNVKFGNITLADTDINAFTANYDADGKCLWAIQSKRLVLAKGNGIATNGTNTVITGTFLGRILEVVGEKPIKGTGMGNFFVTNIK